MCTGYKICDDLKVNEKCFRLYGYDKGDFNELFHEHVPNHRISNSNACEFLRALVIRHSPLGDLEILRTYLNKQGKNPTTIQLGFSVTEYPEKGVLRQYLSSNGICSWFDTIINSKQFRKRPIIEEGK
jgi:hypothetical protein